VPSKRTWTKIAFSKYEQRTPETGSADYEISDFEERIDIF
jgi:hypothetical protein